MDTTVTDMGTVMVVPFLLILRDRKVTTVDITVKDMVTAMVALLPLIPRHRKVTSVDSIPDMVDTTTTKRIQFKLSFFFFNLISTNCSKLKYT